MRKKKKRKILFFCLLYNDVKTKIYTNIILPVTWCGCETWSLMLKEPRLKMFENRVLRGIFGSKREEVKGSWRKLHNEEFNSLCSSPNVIRMIKSRTMRWSGRVARAGEMINKYQNSIL
jgi:hypothetical protein